MPLDGVFVPDVNRRASNLQINVQVAVPDRRCLLLNAWSVGMSTALPLKMAEVAAQADANKLTPKPFHVIRLMKNAFRAKL